MLDTKTNSKMTEISIKVHVEYIVTVIAMLLEIQPINVHSNDQVEL